MMIRIKYGALLAGLLLVLPLPAQTLDECHRLARQHYPVMRQYDLIAQTEQYSLSNAARAWIPQVVLSAQATYQSATATFPEAMSNLLAAQGYELSGLSKDQYRLAVDVNQPLWDGGQSRAQKAALVAEADEQRRSADVDLYALDARVDELYFGILLLDERIALTQAQITLLQSNLDRMRSYCKNGVALQADADALEAELLTVRQALQQAEVSRNAFRQMLSLFIGQPLKVDQLTRPEASIRPDSAVARPELAWFDARMHALSTQEKAVHSSVMPRFSAFAQGFYGNPGLDMFKSMLSDRWTLNGLIGLRMTWNIGAFWTRDNTLHTLRTARSRVEVQRDIFLFNTQLISEQEERELARLREVVADDARIVALRRSVRMAAESQLAHGVIQTSDLLRKITDEAAADWNQRTHEIELLQTIYKLKHTRNQ